MLLLRLRWPVFQKKASLRLHLLREPGLYKFASENYFLINKKEKSWGVARKGEAVSLYLSAFCLSFSKHGMMNGLFKWIYFSTWIEAWSDFLKNSPKRNFLFAFSTAVEKGKACFWQ